MDILNELQCYFKATPREQVLKEWEESSEYDDIGPLLIDFLDLRFFFKVPSYPLINNNIHFQKKYPELFGIFLL